MNNITALQKYFCDILAQDKFFVKHNVAALYEDQMDIGYEIDNAMTSMGLSATVMIPDVSLVGADENGVPIGVIDQLIISISEDTITNRARAGACIARDVAVRCVALLNSPECQWQHNRSRPIEDGLTVTNVIFATTLQVAMNDNEENTGE